MMQRKLTPSALPGLPAALVLPGSLSAEGPRTTSRISPRPMIGRPLIVVLLSPTT